MATVVSCMTKVCIRISLLNFITGFKETSLSAAVMPLSLHQQHLTPKGGTKAKKNLEYKNLTSSYKQLSHLQPPTHSDFITVQINVLQT